MSVRSVLAAAVVALVAGAAGWWLGTRAPTTAEGGSAAGGPAATGACPGGAEPLYWKAPMDPTYVRQEPGKSPMGMDLVPVCPGEGEDDDSSNAGAIRISSAVVQNIGVKTAPVERRSLSRRVRTVGRVAYDERRVAHVHTKVQGWVEKLYVDYAGEMVEKGAPLLEVYSPELVSTQEELLLAARYRDRVGASTFEDVAEGGQALFRAARRRLELFDIPDRDIDELLRTGQVRKTLTLYAPNGGVVTHLMVREGMEVGPNANLYTIADLARVWVYADVYEYELPWIQEGQSAVAELSYLPDRSLDGVVTYVYPFLDPKTRTARVRLEFDNPGRTLLPDMYANVTIDASEKHDVLVVPGEAVIRSGRRTLAIVALGEGRFQPREVALGLDSGDGWVEVRSGLEEGETVVTSGQFLIDSESKLQEAVQKLLAPTGDSPAAPGSAPAGHEGHDMPSSHEGHR